MKILKNLRVSLRGLKKFLKMSEIEELVNGFGNIKIKNRGTGAGGAKTNANGKTFEELTNNESRLIAGGYTKTVFKNITFEDEVIVVDDGSDDDTIQKIDALSLHYKRSIQVIKTIDAGPARARNFAIDVAKGDFITFLDHDDLWPKDRIKNHLNFFNLQTILDKQLIISYLYPFIVTNNQKTIKLHKKRLRTVKKLLFLYRQITSSC
jgi:cellulose synthase/poly-beta-1,6-N-acetylglucosamine synthase-like glycosyltransferase